MTIRLDAGNLSQTRSDLGLAIGTDVLAPNGSAANLTAIPAAQITGTLPAINGGSVTDLNATNLGTGTVPDGRFPATLPATSGVNLTALNATNLGTGTVADGRLPANLQSFPAPGSDGNILTAASGAWTSAAAASGGAWEVVQNGTIGGTTLILGSLTKTTRVIINKYSGSGNMVVEYSIDGGNTYLTTGLEVSADDAYTTTEWTNGAAGFNSSPWGSLYTGIMDYTIFRPEQATAPIMARFETSGTFSARGGYDTIQGHVRYNTASAVNRLKFSQFQSTDRFLVLRMTYT